jgi:hypothetical protein
LSFTFPFLRAAAPSLRFSRELGCLGWFISHSSN